MHTGRGGPYAPAGQSTWEENGADVAFTFQILSALFFQAHLGRSSVFVMDMAISVREARPQTRLDLSLSEHKKASVSAFFSLGTWL